MSDKTDIKHCNSCHRDLPNTRECFYFRNKNKNLLHSFCLECDNKKKNENRKINQSDAKYYLKNRERIKARNKEYYQRKKQEQTK